MDEHTSVRRTPAPAAETSLIDDVVRSAASSLAGAESPSVEKPKVELTLQFQTFSVLWSVAALFVVWQRLDVVSSEPVQWFVSGGIVAAAIVGLICSSWAWPVVLVGLLHCANAFLLSPHTSSSDWIFAFFGATILMSYLSSVIVTRSHRASGTSLYRSFVAPLRIISLVSLFALE